MIFKEGFVKRFLFAFSVVFLFIFSSLAFSAYELSLLSPYIEYDLNTHIIEAEHGVTISYNGYSLKGANLYFDLRKKRGEISSAIYKTEDFVYCGDIYFSKEALRILDGKVYKDTNTLFGAKKIILYPNEFLQVSSLTFYTKDGTPIFGLPYYSKLVFLEGHDIFPKITVSGDNLSFKSFLDYYGSTSSFGFFAFSWTEKEGLGIGWTHYLSKTFGFSLDYEDGKIVYGLNFGGPVSLFIKSNLEAEFLYNFDDKSFIKNLSLRYVQESHSLTCNTRFRTSVGDIGIYTDLSYIVTKGEWESLKVGISPKISPFRLDLDYDFVKKEVGIWLHLDI